MADGDQPEYKVYRSRPGLLSRLGGGGGGGPLGRLRRRRERRPDQPPGIRPRRRITPGRVLKWLALAVLTWLVLSAVVFFVSAQTQDGVSDEAEEALDGGSNLFGGSNILVLGSDARPEGSKEPGANQAAARSDSILVLHVGFGTVRRLSILRDSQAAIPGHGVQKINAAYAFGGAALAIETVEGFLGNGIEIHHVMEVSFADFPQLIDALGGIEVKLRRCVISDSFSGTRVRLRRGTHRLNGRRALAFARVRNNRCAPNEDDRARAARQQQVLSAIRSQAVSPRTFIRLPWVAWAAPRTVRSDMRGPGLMALFTDLLTGGAGKTRVLRPSGVGADGSLIVSDDEKARAVEELLEG